jgi:hypothetical protein
MDSTTLLLVAIFYVLEVGVAAFIAQARGRAIGDAVILALFLGPLGLLIVAFQTDVKRPSS